MDAILSDCSIGVRDHRWWCKLNDEDWSRILAHAAHINYPFRDALWTIKRLAVAQHFDHAAFNTLVENVRKQHRRVYRWFKSKHGAESRFAYIPADLRGMIDEYLRADIIDGDTSITTLMGSRHSFADEPCQRVPYMLAWYKHGKVHREGAPAVVCTSPNQSRVTFMWFENERAVKSQSGQLFSVTYGYGKETIYYVKYPGTVSPLGDKTTNPDHIAEMREICRRDLGIELP